MSRHLRFIPDSGALVEVTCRTIQGRLLLCPSQQFNDTILGVLGRAQREYPVEIVAYVFASNHYHLLLRVDHAKGPEKADEGIEEDLASHPVGGALRISTLLQREA